MKKKPYRLSCYITKVFETSGNHTEWGGYYTYSFLSSDNKKLLCHRANFDKRQITSDDRVELGWYDIETGVWHSIGYTDSFNWQQGAMLQWVPGTQNRKVIFNVSKDGKLISRIVDIESGESQDLCCPIYSLSPDGETAITLNFERSYWTLAYHYQSVKNEELNVPVVPGDGIFSLNLKTNTPKRIVSLEDVIAIDPEQDFSDGVHWLEHIVVNREGTKFVFLHRFRTKKSVRTTRMFIADIDGSNLTLVDNWRNFSWSHFGWKTETDFAMYAVRSTTIGNVHAQTESSGNGNTLQKSVKSLLLLFAKIVYRKFLKSLIPVSLRRRLAQESGYQVYQWEGDERYVWKDTYNGKLMDIDGHPTFDKTGKYMITDSYADEQLYRRLIVWNTENHKGVVVGKFFAPMWGMPSACDLHPKLSTDEQYLVVDTACHDTHQMMVFKINWEKVKRTIS